MTLLFTNPSNLIGTIDGLPLYSAGGQRWQHRGELTFYESGCGFAECFEVGCDPDYGEEGKPLSSGGFTEACAFQLVKGYTCTTQNFNTDQQLNQFIQTSSADFDNVLNQSVIRTVFDLLSGEGCSSCYEEQTIVCPEELAVVDGIGVTEDYLNSQGCGNKYIFVPSGAANYLNCCQTNSDGVLTTALGSIIIPVATDTPKIFGVCDPKVVIGDKIAVPEVDNPKNVIVANKNKIELRYETIAAFGFSECAGIAEQSIKFC